MQPSRASIHREEDLLNKAKRIVGTAALQAAHSLSGSYGGYASHVMRERARGKRNGDMQRVSQGGKVVKVKQPAYDDEDSESDDPDEGREARPEFLDFIHQNSSNTIITPWQQELVESGERIMRSAMAAAEQRAHANAHVRSMHPQQSQHHPNQRSPLQPQESHARHAYQTTGPSLSFSQRSQGIPASGGSTTNLLRGSLAQLSTTTNNSGYLHGPTSGPITHPLMSASARIDAATVAAASLAVPNNSGSNSMPSYMPMHGRRAGQQSSSSRPATSDAQVVLHSTLSSTQETLISTGGDSSSMGTILPLSSFAAGNNGSSAGPPGYSPTTSGTPPRRGPLDLRASGEVVHSPSTSLGTHMGLAGAGSISAPSSSSLLGGQRSQVRLLPATSSSDEVTITSSSYTGSTSTAASHPDRTSGTQHSHGTGYGMLLHFGSDNGSDAHSRLSPGNRLGAGARSDLLGGPHSPLANGGSNRGSGHLKSNKSNDGRWHM